MAEEKKHPLPGMNREVSIPTDGWKSIEEYEKWWREQGADDKHSLVVATITVPDGRRVRGIRVILADPTGKDFQLRRYFKSRVKPYRIAPINLLEERLANTRNNTHRITRREKVIRRYYTCFKNGDHFPLVIFSPDRAWFPVGMHRTNAVNGKFIKRQGIADYIIGIIPEGMDQDEESNLERLTNYEHREGESKDEAVYAIYDRYSRQLDSWDPKVIGQMYREYNEVHDENKEMFVKRLIGLELWLKTGKSEELRVPPIGHPRSMATFGEVAIHFGGREAIRTYPVRRWFAIWSNTNNGVLSRIRAGQGGLKLTGTPEERWQQYQAHLANAEQVSVDRKLNVPTGVDDKTRLLLNLTYWKGKSAGKLLTVRSEMDDDEKQAVRETLQSLYRVFVDLT